MPKPNMKSVIVGTDTYRHRAVKMSWEHQWKSCVRKEFCLPSCQHLIFRRGIALRCCTKHTVQAPNCQLCLRSHCTLKENLELCSHIHPPLYLLRQSAWFLLHHSLGMVLSCAGYSSADSPLPLLVESMKHFLSSIVKKNPLICPSRSTKKPDAQHMILVDIRLTQNRQLFGKKSPQC